MRLRRLVESRGERRRAGARDAIGSMVRARGIDEREGRSGWHVNGRGKRAPEHVEGISGAAGAESGRRGRVIREG